MEGPFLRVEKVQASLCSLSLEDKEEVTAKFKDKTLVGKLLTTRKFNRGTLSTIIEGAWSTKRKVRVQMLGENLFKFTFELKKGQRGCVRQKTLVI